MVRSHPTVPELTRRMAIPVSFLSHSCTPFTFQWTSLYMIGIYIRLWHLDPECHVRPGTRVRGHRKNGSSGCYQAVYYQALGTAEDRRARSLDGVPGHHSTVSLRR